MNELTQADSKMKPVQHLLAIVLIALLAACSVPKDEWVTFTSAAGNFSVRVPGAMQESVNVTGTPLGPIEAHVFTLQHGAYHYSITYTDYPVPHLAEANPVGAVEGEVLQTLEALGATISNKRDIFLDDAFGIQFRGTLPSVGDSDGGGVVAGRVYLNKTRPYQLVVVARTAQVDTATPQKFFDSFQWLSTPE